ncbi:MAG: 6-phosphofructokinase [Candidatus Omnitrophota bacterium]|nr:MAG: 6-phosphofructokinase [Candidatus Omnitrophota bacterium]
MKVGVLTGGGDCPGLNAVIRAITRRGLQEGYQILGFKDGWLGVIKNNFVSLDLSSVSGILPRGGTILGTSRTNPYKNPEDVKAIKENLGRIDALIAIGGEDTLGVACKLVKEENLKIVGVPKTIDNDLSATDYTFGFDTAINIVMEAIDRLHTTAESHHRVMVIEVMGRHSGWIAIEGGIAGGADVILIPEIPIDIEEVVRLVKRRNERGRNFSIVVVAEGAKFKESDEFILQEEKRDAFGHVHLGGIGNVLAKEIEKRTGFETRTVVLGHLQRGGSPSAFDRVLGTRLGIKAIELVKEGRFGQMAALQGNRIVSVPLEDAVGSLKMVDTQLYEVAKVFFG